MADAIDPRQLPATTQPYAAQPMTAQPPAQSDDLTSAMTRASQMGTEAFGQEEARRQQLASQLAQLMQQRQGMAGDLSYHPNFQPMTGQGIGHDIGNVFGNIGRGLLSFGASTAPGQALQNVIYSQPRQQYGTLTQSIQDIQKQMGSSPEAMGAAGGMVSKPISAVGGLMRGQAAMSRADAEQFRVRTIDQARVKLEAEANRIREEVGKGHITAENARTQMMGLIAQENNATKTQVASMITDTQLANEQTRAAEDDFKTMSDHLLQNILGIAPSKPVTTAVGRTQGKNADGGKNVAAGTIVYDGQGKAHRADGTAPLPQGWSLHKKTKK